MLVMMDRIMGIKSITEREEKQCKRIETAFMHLCRRKRDETMRYGEIELQMTRGEYARQSVLNNLLVAHSRLSEKGTDREIIALSKYILKLSKQFDKELFDLGAINGYQSAYDPPNDSKNNIT